MALMRSSELHKKATVISEHHTYYQPMLTAGDRTRAYTCMPTMIESRMNALQKCDDSPLVCLPRSGASNVYSCSSALPFACRALQLDTSVLVQLYDVICLLMISLVSFSAIESIWVLGRQVCESKVSCDDCCMFLPRSRRSCSLVLDASVQAPVSIRFNRCVAAVPSAKWCRPSLASERSSNSRGDLDVTALAFRRFNSRPKPWIH
jgi:hypothetical protein